MARRARHPGYVLSRSPIGSCEPDSEGLCWCACLLQGAQGASLPLVARLLTEIPTWKPTLLINNGDISYARCGTALRLSCRA